MDKRMFKFVAVFLVIIFTFSVSGCNNSSTQVASDKVFEKAIEKKIDRIASPQNSKVSASSNPYDYILSTDSNKDYKDIVAGGEKSLNFLLNKFASSNSNGLKEYIMAIACAEILKEDIAVKGWSSGRQWYNNYVKKNVLSEPDKGLTKNLVQKSINLQYGTEKYTFRELFTEEFIDKSMDETFYKKQYASFNISNDFTKNIVIEAEDRYIVYVRVNDIKGEYFQVIHLQKVKDKFLITLIEYDI